jgi:hypothetical protein
MAQDPKPTNSAANLSSYPHKVLGTKPVSTQRFRLKIPITVQKIQLQDDTPLASFPALAAAISRLMMRVKNSMMAFRLGAVAIVSLHGCSMAAITGDMLSEYTYEHITPHLLSTDDVVMACETGISTTGMLMSYRRVTDAPDKAAIVSMATAAGCAEMVAVEHELRQARSLRAGQATIAQDARIAEKQAHANAARRYYQSYLHLVAHYGEPGSACPELELESDEFAYLVGLLSGASAVRHDRAAEGEINVPLDLPIRVARATECLEDKKWWGVPSALQAAIWLGVPGAQPEGSDPWQQMAKARATGAASGIRIAHAVSAQAALAGGKRDLLKDVIKELAAARAQVAPPAQWRLLDHTAALQARFISDRLWTEATGHRTPHLALGTFWDDEQALAEGDEDLLDAFDEDEPAHEE